MFFLLSFFQPRSLSRYSSLLQPPFKNPKQHFLLKSGDRIHSFGIFLGVWLASSFDFGSSQLIWRLIPSQHDNHIVVLPFESEQTCTYQIQSLSAFSQMCVYQRCLVFSIVGPHVIVRPWIRRSIFYRLAQVLESLIRLERRHRLLNPPTHNLPPFYLIGWNFVFRDIKPPKTDHVAPASSYLVLMMW